MDLTQGYHNIVQDFFQQSRINTLALPLQNPNQQYQDDQEIFKFENHRNESQIAPPNPPLKQYELDEYYKQQNDQNSLSNLSSNHIQNLLEKEPSQAIKGVNDESINKLKQRSDEGQQSLTEQRISRNDLEQIITFIVQLQSNSFLMIDSAIQHQFPQLYRIPLVQVLIQKFSKLKKTKEQLIKYCMRKAFKFIVELPKDNQVQGDKKQKYSFSKCKNKYVKRVSQQKSMNNKFLHQIFTANDFKRDYLLFLQHFQTIMMEDNSKKIAYLASLLTTQPQSQHRNPQMVKRLPWTTHILNKVLAISKDLLKFADNTASP